MVSFADWHRVKRDTKYIAQIRFLIDFLISLRNRSQLACSVVRDLETEYPSLMIELRPPNGELSVEVLYFKDSNVVGLLLTKKQKHRLVLTRECRSRHKAM